MMTFYSSPNVKDERKSRNIFSFVTFVPFQFHCMFFLFQYYFDLYFRLLNYRSALQRCGGTKIGCQGNCTSLAIRNDLQACP